MAHNHELWAILFQIRLSKKWRIMPNKLLILILAFASLLYGQTSLNIKSIWVSSGSCDFGCHRLEILKENNFILTSIINTIYYGTYSVSMDTLELTVSKNRDYYEGDGELRPHDSIWKFIIKDDELIPFFFEIIHNNNHSKLINKLDKSCSLGFSKQNNVKRF